MPFFDFEKVLTYEDSHDDMLKELQAMRKLAEENNIKYKKDYAQQYNKKFKVADRELKIGDNIMIEHEGKKGANPKLQPIFLGPYEVVELRPQGVAYQHGRHVRVVHYNRIKRATIPDDEVDIEKEIRETSDSKLKPPHPQGSNENFHVNQNNNPQQTHPQTRRTAWYNDGNMQSTDATTSSLDNVRGKSLGDREIPTEDSQIQDLSQSFRRLNHSVDSETDKAAQRRA